MSSALTAIAALMAREALGRRQQPRGLPPGERLDDAQTLTAMRGDGSADGRTAAGYLYHSARLTQVLAGRQRCVDLGCGSGVQLLQVAALNPTVSFIGVDRSPLLLAAARADAARLGLANVSLVEDDLTRLASFGDASVDAVIGTMSLHCLPDRAALRACLQHMARIGTPDMAVYLEDFARLKSPRSIDYFLSRHAPVRPDAFAALYGAFPAGRSYGLYAANAGATHPVSRPTLGAAPGPAGRSRRAAPRLRAGRMGWRSVHLDRPAAACDATVLA